jgi:hypothetical protein
VRHTLASGLVGMFGAMFVLFPVRGPAQNAPYERTFHQSKAQVEKALKQLQPAMSGRLPILEGFANAAGHSLTGYQRGYYQATVQVSSPQSGGAVVRVIRS